MKEILETIYELFKTIIFVLVMAFLIRYFVFQPFMVQGISMEPNLHDGEYLIVDRLSYHLHGPKRGDIVVIEAPDQKGVDYIKRVIGQAGDEVKITNDQISVNGNILQESYVPNDSETLVNDSSSAELSIKVGLDEVFVMGDNRQHSLDSRIFGTIKKQAIVGRAYIILYPLDFFGKISAPSY